MHMNETVDYNDLLKNYRDLQLRVTRFSIVEQELINTRDKLDHELDLYKRLNNFNERAWSCASDQDFIELITESIIDIIEVEKSIFFIDAKNGNGHQFFFVGISADHYDLDLLMSNLNTTSIDWPDNKAHIISKEYLHHLSQFQDDSQLLYFRFFEENANMHIGLIGVISEKKLPIYAELQERHKTIFSVFSQQVKSHFAQRENKKRIEEQIGKISRSQLELKKLSLIATKTKNGVIITDREGKIEWVNEAFEQMTEYSLREVIGKKPKDFLQRDHQNNESSQKISAALKEKENIKTTIVNYTKSGKAYYNQLEITPVFDQFGEHINFISLQKDITEELATQQEILRINSRYEQIANHAKIGIWEWEVAHNKVTWNDVLIEQYGLNSSAKELPLFEIWKYSIHEEDRIRVEEQIQSLKTGEQKVQQIEYRITRNDNKESRVLECITIAERDFDNNLIRLIGSSIDVTESRISEQKLKSSEEKYRGLIENMNIGLVEKNLAKRPIYSNTTFLHYNQQSNKKLSIDATTFEEFTELIEKEQIISFNTVEENKTEITVADQNGKHLTYLMSYAPVYDVNHKIKGSIQTFLDVTALKSLQHSLQRTIHERDSYISKVSNLKSFYENILNESPAEIGVLSPKLQLTYANQKSHLTHHIWTQLSRQQITGTSSKDQFVQRLIQAIDKSIETRRINQIEEVINERMGVKTYKLHSILPYFGPSDNLEYLIISAVDITRLKRTEEKVLKSNRELKKINSELDNFVYSVSHDLRSPLLAIKGILNLVNSQLEISPQLAQYLKHISTSVNRLDDTIQEILEYSRNSRLDLKIEEVNVETMVNDIFADLKYAAGLEIELTTEILGSPLLQTDKARISTLLKNLISNSIKYRKKDIELPFVHFKLDNQEKHFCITIEDNGEGISEKNLPRVFEMFYRATNSNVGTGLGLYIVSEIVQKLGGKIELNSTLGEGTTVKLIFPRR